MDLKGWLSGWLVDHPYALGLIWCPLQFVTCLLSWLLSSPTPLFSTPSKHADRVANVRREFLAKRSAGGMCTARPDRDRISSRTLHGRTNRLDTSTLKHVLEIDYEQGIVWVEPLVRIADLTAKLLPNGYTVPVVPELEDLTIGGMLMGCGIESSSFKYGMFDACCVEYEMLMPSGQVMLVTEACAPELFHSLPWSHGTLGMLLSAKLLIVPCRPYVTIKCTQFNCMHKLATHLEEQTSAQSPTVEFIEAIIYSDTSAVCMTGQYTEKPAATHYNLRAWHSQWFYKLVQRADHDISFSTFDYFHRHSKSVFWLLPYSQPWGHWAVFRWLFGWVNPPAISSVKKYMPQSTVDASMSRIALQDYMFPLEHLHEALPALQQALNVFPIWVCPHLIPHRPVCGLMHPHGDASRMYIDLGFYGLPDNGRCTLGNGARLNSFGADGMNAALAKCEGWLVAHDGYVMLYAQHCFDQEQFGRMFEHMDYNKIRAKFSADEVFADVWSKVKSRGST